MAASVGRVLIHTTMGRKGRKRGKNNGGSRVEVSVEWKGVFYDAGTL